MSKEKQCECCHEWWYDSDVKENLCPNCYDYFKQLKQQLDQANEDKMWLNVEIDTLKSEKENLMRTLEEASEELEEKDKEIAHLKEKDNYHLRYELAGADETITNLKQQLEEKDKEIEFCKEEIRKRNKRIDEIVERDKKLFDDKNKEIELLKHLGKHETATEMFKENTKLIIEKTQLAIQELEKVNGILTDTIIEVTQNEMDLNKLCYLEEISARFYEKMQEQIKELKGKQI